MNFEQPTAPPTGLLKRLPTPAFWFLALCAGSAGAAVLFMVAGLSVDAITHSSSAAGLSGLGGALVGFVAPIFYLRIHRAGPKTPSVRKEPTALTTVNEVGKQTDGLDAPPQTPLGPAEWFYAEDGKRLGPVSAEDLQRMVTDGVLSRTTLVWRQGMADWIKIADSILADKATPTAPPPLSAGGIANGYIWALALAPFWGEILHYVAVYAYLGFNQEPEFLWPLRAEQLISKTWYFQFALNWGLALADEQALSAAGWKSDKLNKWLVFLVPIYIYKRDQLVGANMTRFWVWIGAVVASAFLV